MGLILFCRHHIGHHGCGDEDWETLPCKAPPRSNDAVNLIPVDEVHLAFLCGFVGIRDLEENVVLGNDAMILVYFGASEA